MLLDTWNIEPGCHICTHDVQQTLAATHVFAAFVLLLPYESSCCHRGCLGEALPVTGKLGSTAAFRVLAPSFHRI